jgi:N6-L-threonylcarbamoyladenine synthase
VLSDAGSGYAELDAIGVGTGPGNFTGIRIAVSAARGLSLGLGIPAVGVPVFDALRHGTDAPCACAIAAPRGQVYLQRFAADGSGTAPELVSADAIPAHDGPLIGACGQTPVHPTAVAVALLAAERARGAATPRPAPVYLRPADAAPARDAAPVILP